MRRVLTSLWISLLTLGCSLDQKLAATDDVEDVGDGDDGIETATVDEPETDMEETDSGEADAEPGDGAADTAESDPEIDESGVDSGEADDELGESATDTGETDTEPEEGGADSGETETSVEEDDDSGLDEEIDTDADLDPEEPDETPSVGEPPSIRIYMPDGSGVYSTTGLAMFAAYIDDDMDAPEALTVQWETDIIGAFGFGEISDEGTDDLYGVAYAGRAWIMEDCELFGVGAHTLKATVTDSDGLSSSDTVPIRFGTPD